MSCLRQPRPRTEIIDRLHQEMQKIMSAPEMKKRATDIGLLPIEFAVG